MPASTLPTRSAPTSAPLVKIPPPRRAKIEIERGAEAKRDERVDDDAVIDGVAKRPCQHPVIDSDAEQRETGDKHAGHSPRLEGNVEAGAKRMRSGLGGADIGAHRDVHADEAGGARQNRADQEPDRDGP